MVSGVPREIKNTERRVALTRLDVRELIRSGNRMLIQESIGMRGMESDDGRRSRAHARTRDRPGSNRACPDKVRLSLLAPIRLAAPSRLNRGEFA